MNASINKVNHLIAKFEKKSPQPEDLIKLVLLEQSTLFSQLWVN
jgi:hypothetical protein